MRIGLGGVLLLAFGCAWGLACGDDDPDAAAAIPSGNPNGEGDGGDCAKGFDCKSGVCTAGKCAVPTTTDKVRNGTETGVDCGGPDATPCGGGQPCKLPSDCASGECAAEACTGPAIPPAPRSDDQKRNGDESDVDCGGTSTGAPRCTAGKNCRIADDCDSRICGGNAKCVVPSATDGIANGDESDVDCGGKTTNAPRCAAGKKCIEASDCASDGCDDQSRCAVSRSCTKADGGRTCGTGNVGDPNAQHESCCVALPIPGQATRLDKYKITAGRMRVFIERERGNVKGWYEANKAKLGANAVAQIDPYVRYLPADLNEAHFHLGGAILWADRPSIAQGCFTGNAMNVANGAHTYWTPVEADALPEDREDRAFDKAFLDRLPLNCVPYPLLAAFCAWDGGRLQTFEESSAAYGSGIYPWGDAPAAGGFLELPEGSGDIHQVGPAGITPAMPVADCPGCDTTRMNWASNYQFPEGGVAAKPWDYAFYISAPGRFPLDKGPGGHMDVGGVMMEITASGGRDLEGNPRLDDAAHENQLKMRWSRAGSFEAHQANNDKWQFAFMTKYGKTSGRCARD